jgi:hypothetical protein
MLASGNDVHDTNPWMIAEPAHIVHTALHQCHTLLQAASRSSETTSTCFQYLVDLGVSENAARKTGYMMPQFVLFLQDKVKQSGNTARLVRAHSIAEGWPNLLAQYEAKCATMFTHAAAESARLGGTGSSMQSCPDMSHCTTATCLSLRKGSDGAGALQAGQQGRSCSEEAGPRRG